ncbi:NADP-dependent malate dehydrogenase [Cavenderia fasciculata]|uniref:Malic enzyme n=1 Tax=Cavenderia fasciculata TaxID=261658 RepID=F4Q337_CACFS|nr:NADP-dependent malate dehydrogenase [Cavenderia fasciculata]EGG16759.1 NADP-dependent malate dehydrogenase [Cavenderia fasciculata]|eukprot:XP_004355233.1 NADP-dependent malate dehydrogenase [Cavenderia fasciculata]
MKAKLYLSKVIYTKQHDNIIKTSYTTTTTSFSSSTTSTTSTITTNNSSHYQPLQPLAINNTDSMEKNLQILRSSFANRGTAFTREERDKLGLRGLLPPREETIEDQAERCLVQFHSFGSNLEKYVFLNCLRDRNETLFYYLLTNNLELMMPIVYTPTVGEACQKFGNEFRFAQGMYFATQDRGEIRRMLDNWPNKDVDIIVVSDGSRILGLGDLGTNGMGIPVGKLQLYVAGAGFNPAKTLPVIIDAGTNTKKYLDDKFYLGEKHARIKDEEYYALMDEFLSAVYNKWPKVLVQFEDISNDHCFALLENYRNKYFCFNDDIQGTGSVILSGFINCIRAVQKPITEHRLVFLGAGSAGIGVADCIMTLFQEAGMSEEDARKCFWFVDSKGLITTTRGDELTRYKKAYARGDVAADKQLKSLADVVRSVKPTAIIGLSGIGGSFTQEVVEEMARLNEKPIVMALSNPTSNAECTAEQAYTWSQGRCIFASGSPFAPVQYNGKTLIPGQGNNMYIFPALGLGSVVVNARHITDGMVIAAAKSLASQVDDSEVIQGKIYPGLHRIRELSVTIAVAVAEKAYEEGMAQLPRPDNLEQAVRDFIYHPHYDQKKLD